MNHDHLLRVALSCCLLSALNPAACAQSSSSSKTAPQTSTAAENEGIESGNYRVQQSIEMAYRFTDTSGSDSAYNTCVNLQTGQRCTSVSTLGCFVRFLPLRRNGENGATQEQPQF